MVNNGRLSYQVTRMMALVALGICVFVTCPDTARGQCEFTQHAQLVADESDNMGSSVAISGDTAVIWSDIDLGIDDTPGAYVFVRDPDGSGDWVQQSHLLPAGDSDQSSYGSVVALSGDTAVLGAGADNAAYVFVRNPRGTKDWVQQATLEPADGIPGALFGRSVSIDGEVVLIGAYSDDSNGDRSGSAYVFVRVPSKPGSWSQEAKLIPTDNMELQQFGRSVAIDGEIAVIGAWWSDELVGAAYVFVVDPVGSGIWVQQAKLVAEDGASEDFFGESVAIDGNTVVVSAPSPNSPASYVFKFDGSTWAQTAKLTPNGGPANGIGDHSVAVVGDTILIGAPDFQGTVGSHSGAAYVFGYDGTSWVQRAVLLPDDGASNDWFGTSVAMSGETVVIGAPYHGDGAAYMFDISDCNGNAAIDGCDIADGISSDHNNNHIPDECDCPGDTNGDRSIDPLDAGFVLARFGCEYPLDGSNCHLADLNNDGVVDPLDVGFVLCRFGMCE